MTNNNKNNEGIFDSYLLVPNPFYIIYELSHWLKIDDWILWVYKHMTFSRGKEGVKLLHLSLIMFTRLIVVLYSKMLKFFLDLYIPNDFFFYPSSMSPCRWPVFCIWFEFNVLSIVGLTLHVMWKHFSFILDEFFHFDELA